MNGIWICIWRWTRTRAHVIRVFRPMDRKSFCSPHLFGESSILATRKPVHHAGGIAEAHLKRSQRWSLRLISDRIVEANARGSHIPEPASNEVCLVRVIVQHRSECRVCMGLRFSVAES